MEQACLASLLLIARTPGVHARQLKAAWGASDSQPAAADPIEALLAAAPPPHTRAALERPDRRRLEADLRWVSAHDCRVLACTDRAYPATLLELIDAPAVLFVQGAAAALAQPQAAVVGARAASLTGRAIAREFAFALARAGLTVTSGLAVGIDAAAHEGALEAGGTTVAVCATGLDRLYPRANLALAARIRATGALVSERPPGTPPWPGLFPRRNRLIAALCRATVVVEATPESGSLGTARTATGLSRRVFAVPGSTRSRLAQGCHQLIRAGATLAGSAADVLQDLGITSGNQHPSPSMTQAPDPAPAAGSLDKAAEMLLDAAGFEPVGIDFLVERTGLSGPVVASLLLVLELRGRVAPHPGGRYCRLT
ncbi:MAG TPA: DNA-processing protein DprA [Steroidobacteraceae bacterium]|nr:DNA-processing protein DprA [Steroidobacteraceae bacterium]